MKKGFTLIELLGVVTILGILALVLFPILLRHINNARNSIDEVTQALIIDAAKDYYENNINNYEKINGISYCIDINSLDKYLINIKDENLNDIDKTKKIKMTYNNKFEYQIVDSCTYSLVRNGIEVPIVDENSGLYLSTTDEGRLIYRGGTPNNYIWLDEDGNGNKANDNSELYRIVSFEKDGTIKVIRNDSIGTKAWDTAGNRTSDNGNTYCTLGASKGCNTWGNTSNIYSNGQTLDVLNRDFYFEYYLNNTNLSLQKSDSGTVTLDASLNIYLNSKTTNEIDSWQPARVLDNYIVNHDFNVGGIYYYNDYSGGDKGIEREKYENSLLTWKGKIGLMDITEYVEASINPNCTSIYSNYQYAKDLSGNLISNQENFEWPCSTDHNWIKKGVNEWTLSSNPYNNHYVLIVYTSGYFDNSESTNDSYGVRPSFYIKSNIVLEGSGTDTDPYSIKN